MYFNDIPDNINEKELSIFIPSINYGRVIKVYDGDTITIASYLSHDKDKLYKFNIRILGVDCPEIKSKNENEKKVAIIARDKLKDLILGKIIELKNLKNDKYGGRYNANVFIDGLSCSEWLIDNRLAVEYDGGKKKNIEDWLLFYNNNNNNID